MQAKRRTSELGQFWAKALGISIRYNHIYLQVLSGPNNPLQNFVESLDNFSYQVHSKRMIVDKRKHSRIAEIGKIEAQDLCLFPGVLVDISKVGCRVRFPTSFLVDTDFDYELKLSSVRQDFVDPLFITVKPIWQNSSTDSTEIGFSIINSQNSKMFDAYIDKLIEEKESIESEQDFMDGIEL